MGTDPITIMEAVAAAWTGLRLCHATADWLVCTGRARLVRAAAALPPGTCLVGRGWEIRVPAGAVRR